MSMGAEEAEFEARLEVVAATAAFVNAFCERHAIPAGDALRLTLIVEELFLNIVTHGYAAAAGTVRIALSLDASHVRLVCEDSARAYDPRAAFALAPGDLDAPVASRSIGGLGQWIVGQLAEVEGYERAGDVNRLTLRFRRAGYPAPDEL